MCTWKVLILALLAINLVNGAKILAIFNHPTYSHYLLGHNLLKGLADKGHDVTMMSPFGKENTNAKYKNIHLDGVIEEFYAINKEGSIMDYLPSLPPIKRIIMHNKGLINTELTLKHKNIQKLLKNNESFDIVIVEHFFNNPLKAICNHYKAHCIAFSPTGANDINNYLVANPSPVAYIPDAFASYSSDMTYLQRVDNFLLKMLAYILYNIFYICKENDLMHKYFPDTPHIHDLNSNISLLFLNSHITVNAPIPHVPNMIEIGGIHIEQPKQLPEDLQNFMNNSKNGVIYINIGSTVVTNKMKQFLEVFGKLDMNIIWKLEGTHLQNVPKNVLPCKNCEQSDILAQPNVKLFITHDDMSAIIEAVHYGIPFVGITSILEDQGVNTMAEVIRYGLGVGISFKDMDEKMLSDAIDTVLNDNRYKKMVMERSVIMKDRPITPLETGIYWVEFVLRHNGTSHMKSVAVDMTWYTYLSIDVMVLLGLFDFILILAVAIPIICIIKSRYDAKLKQKEA